MSTESTPPRRATFDDGDFAPPSATDGSTDAPSAVRCAYCERPFAREEWLALHRGHAHPDYLDDAEIEAFRAAHATESDALGRFRLLALGALVLLYFGLLLVYALLAL